MADVPEDEVYGHIPHDPAQYKKFEQVPPYWQGVIEDVHDLTVQTALQGYPRADTAGTVGRLSAMGRVVEVIRAPEFNEIDLPGRQAFLQWIGNIFADDASEEIVDSKLAFLDQEIRTKQAALDGTGSPGIENTTGTTGKAKAREQEGFSYHGRRRRTSAGNEGGQPSVVALRTRSQAAKAISRPDAGPVDDQAEDPGSMQTPVTPGKLPNVARSPRTPLHSPTKRTAPAGEQSPPKRSKADSAPQPVNVVLISPRSGNVYEGAANGNLTRWLDHPDNQSGDRLKVLWQEEVRPLIAHMTSRDTVISFLRAVIGWISDRAEGPMPIRVYRSEGGAQNVEAYLDQMVTSYTEFADQLLPEATFKMVRAFRAIITAFRMHEAIDVKGPEVREIVSEFLERTRGTAKRDKGDRTEALWKEYATMRLHGLTPELWQAQKDEWRKKAVRRYTAHLKYGENLGIFEVHTGQLGLFLLAYAGGRKTDLSRWQSQDLRALLDHYFVLGNEDYKVMIKNADDWIVGPMIDGSSERVPRKLAEKVRELTLEGKGPESLWEVLGDESDELEE